MFKSSYGQVDAVHSTVALFLFKESRRALRSVLRNAGSFLLHLSFERECEGEVAEKLSSE